MKDYQVELYYGYEESTYGVSLEFEVVDPVFPVDVDKIGARLAESFDIDLDDESESSHFNWDSCEIALPESLVERIKADAIREYLASKDEVVLAAEINTKIYYLYRDADNYKTFNECVLPGILTPEQKQTILDCLHEGDGFIPSVVGLPELRNWDWDNTVDHPFFELDEDSFKETSEKATVDVTVEELVASFMENKDKWETLGVEYVAQFEEGFESGVDVDEVISSAVEQAGSATGKTDVDRDIDLS